MEQCATLTFPPALDHGAIEEAFTGVYIVSGAMETVLMDMDWCFSRNMIIVREEGRLILMNSVRLSEQGLAELDKLGQVTDVLRLGALHGRDDAFYIDRYDAQYWAMQGLDSDNDLSAKSLIPGVDLPISNATLFRFETTRVSEGIVHLNRDGGILIACDALQNWLGPDEHFCDASRQRMESMDFFTPANVGPVWQQAAEPAVDDFRRLTELNFKHVLCGHGEPLRDSAKEDYTATFHRLFGN